MPSNPALCSATVAATATGDAWLELQREMGSLKADNRLESCCSSKAGDDDGRGGGGGDSNALRRQASADSLLTRSFGKGSDYSIEATSGALAKTLSLTLDTSASAWKDNREAAVERDIPGACTLVTRVRSREMLP